MITSFANFGKIIDCSRTLVDFWMNGFLSPTLRPQKHIFHQLFVCHIDNVLYGVLTAANLMSIGPKS